MKTNISTQDESSSEDADYIGEVYVNPHSGIVKVTMEFKDFKTWQKYEKYIKCDPI